MGRTKVEDLPRHNAAALQIEVHQGALARDPDAVLGRLSALLGGPAHRELRVAFAEWIWHSLAPDQGPSNTDRRVAATAPAGAVAATRTGDFYFGTIGEYYFGTDNVRGTASRRRSKTPHFGGWFNVAHR